MKKTWKEKLLDSHDLPKVETVKKDMMGVKAGERMLIASPEMYNEVVKEIPNGKVRSLPEIRSELAKKMKADVTCPLTAGIFINIVANAAIEMNSDVPWWRVTKANGELNEKYPGGKEEQARLLEIEGHKIDKTQKKWFVVGIT